MKRTLNKRTYKLKRRTFLRGASAATTTVCALPLLEAMFPSDHTFAMSAWEYPRVFAMYAPGGINEPMWFPQNENMDLKGTALESFQTLGLKNYISLYQGMANASYVEKSTGNSHMVAIASWLTGIGIQPHDGLRNAAQATIHRMSLEQEVALHVTKKLNPNAEVLPNPDKLTLRMAGNSELSLGRYDYNNNLKNALNWSVEGKILPLVSDLKAQFYELFGRQVGRGYTQEQEILVSVLDEVKEEFQQLNKRLGQQDKIRLERYENNLREIEIGLHESYKLPPTNEKCTHPVDQDQVVGTPNGERAKSFEKHLAIAPKILAHAMSCGLVYGSSYAAGGEYSGCQYANLGINLHFMHSVIQGGAGRMEKLAKIDRFLGTGAANFLKEFHDTPNGEGSLLDNTALIFGSSKGNGGKAQEYNIGMLVGGNFGQWKHGKHHKTDMQNHGDLINTVREELGINSVPQYRRVAIS